MSEEKLDAIFEAQRLAQASLAGVFSLVRENNRFILGLLARDSERQKGGAEMSLASTKESNEALAALTVSIDFLPMADLKTLVAGTDVLLLMRDFWQGYDEILNARFDGEHFFYKGRKVMPISAIAGWAELPYKLPYLSSDPRFVKPVEAPIAIASTLSEVITQVESWIQSVRAAQSIGMVPPAVSVELIQVLANLPSALSQPGSIPDANR